MKMFCIWIIIRCYFAFSSIHIFEGVSGKKGLSDFWKISRPLGLKYLPVIFTVYSGFSYCLKRTSS